MSKTKTAGKRAPIVFTTKQHLLSIIKMWPDNTLQAIADKIGFTKSRTAGLVIAMRRQGVDLPRKLKSGGVKEMIAEIMSEHKK